MKVGLVLGTIAMFGLVACGNSGSSGVNDSPTTIKTSPAGVATLNFLDLVNTVPVSALSSSGTASPSLDKPEEALSSLNTCIKTTPSGTTTTYTMTTCSAANGGTLAGSLVSVQSPAGTYTETFQLTSTIDSTHSWTYAGQIVVTITGKTATLTAPGSTPLVCTYTDSSNASNNMAYTFLPMLEGDWSSGSMVLSGSYEFDGTQGSVNGYKVKVSMPTGTSLAIPAGCSWPTSGSLSLGLDVPTNSGLNGTVTATFGPNCGQVVIDGATLNLGQ